MRCLILLILSAVLFGTALGCAGGSSSSDGRVSVGFLPTATPVPRHPDALEGYYGWCPPLPGPMCPQDGDTFNLYVEYGLEDVAWIDVRSAEHAEVFVLDPNRVREILRTLDRDLKADAVSPYESIDRASYSLLLHTRPNDAGSRLRIGELRLDDDTDSLYLYNARWPAPQEFVASLFRFASPEMPTPEPAPTATPKIVPARSVFFGHPEDEVEWQGDGPSVYSHVGGHCEWSELRQEFGIPSLIRVDDALGFWAIGPLRREGGWHWTGYSHEEWELWQGSDPQTIYLVLRGEDRIAFEYKAYGCI